MEIDWELSTQSICRFALLGVLTYYSNAPWWKWVLYAFTWFGITFIKAKRD